MNIRIFGTIACVVLLLSDSAGAEEAPIYESLSELTVGRVFFTAKQRIYLDSLRGKSGIPSPRAASPRSIDSKPEKSDAAGFIVRSSGKTRVYQNGDFIEVSSKPEIRFPDDVAVTRKPSDGSGAEDDDSD